MDLNKETIANDQDTLTNMVSQVNADIETMADSDWVSTSFLIANMQLTEIYDAKNRFYSSAVTKWVDTSIGGAVGINPRPQFTRYADVREKGRRSDNVDTETFGTSPKTGMGTYYSEAFDDHAQRIFMTFGVPQFNTLTNFIGRAFHPQVVSMVRTGKIHKSIFKSLGQAIGIGIGAGAWGIRKFIGLSFAVIAGSGLLAMFTDGGGRFYTLKPSMHLYWSTVNNIANNLAIRMGLFPTLTTEPINSGNLSNKVGEGFKVNTAYMKDIAAMFGDVWNDFGDTGGFFDVFAVATKNTRIQHGIFLEEYNKVDKGEPKDWYGYIRGPLDDDAADPDSVYPRTYAQGTDGRKGFAAFFDRITSLRWWFTDENDTSPEATITTIAAEADIDYSKTGKESSSNYKNIKSKVEGKSWFQNFAEAYDSDVRDGSRFAVFQVDYTGPVSDGWSNTARESDLAETLNSFSKKARDVRFNIMDGSLSGVTNVLGKAVGAIADMAEGALSTVTFGLSDSIVGAIKGLSGQGYIDIPKYWDSSNFNPTQASYTIKLRTPYGNPVSRFLNLYVPVCMLMAGTLPLSTGKASYGSPLLCQIFDSGRIQIKLGLITNLTITRGTTNLGFTTDCKPLGIDLNFSVTDLSSIMHMPVSGEPWWVGDILGGLVLDRPDMALDEDNIMSDYLAALAGQSIYSQIYIMPKVKMRVAQALMKANKITSPAYMASALHDLLPIPARILNALAMPNFNSTDVRN